MNYKLYLILCSLLALTVAGIFSGCSSAFATVVTGINIYPTNNVIKAGDNFQLFIEYIPKNATTRESTWRSSNPAVATVDDYGVVIGVSAGTAVITATSVSGKRTSSSTFRVIETNTYPTAISITSVPDKLRIGNSAILGVSMTPATALTDVIWTSSNLNIVSVDLRGRITAKQQGTATITASSVFNSVNGKATITVVPPPKVTSISVNNDRFLLLINQEGIVTVTVHGEYLESTFANYSVTSSVSQVVSVTSAKVGSNTRLTIRGRNAGTATVKVWAEDDRNSFVNINVTVVDSL